MPKSSAKTAPITENEHVKELLGILKTHKSPSMKEFTAVLNHVAAMEKQLEAAVQELTAMRRDYAEAIKKNHPVKNTIERATVHLNSQIELLRERLTELRQAVIDGCKNAVIAFKEKGISALDNITRFFKVSPILEAIHTRANWAAQYASKTASYIDTVSKRYHEAGRHLKNAGRALRGKEAIQDAKPPGMVAKTFSAPFRAARVCFAGVRNNAMAVVGKLKRLEERAAEQKKTSIHKDMDKYNKKIAREERDAPNRKKSRSEPAL